MISVLHLPENLSKNPMVKVEVGERLSWHQYYCFGANKKTKVIYSVRTASQLNGSVLVECMCISREIPQTSHG